MAARTISHSTIFRGRPDTFTVNGNSSEIISLQNIKDGEVKVTEEIKKSTYEVEDATEILEHQGRKLTIEFTYSELSSTDIAAICNGDEIVIATSSGGANSTGMTITVSSCDEVLAYIDDLKTKIIATKATSSLTTLPYTIADNAA